MSIWRRIRKWQPGKMVRRNLPEIGAVAGGLVAGPAGAAFGAGFGQTAKQLAEGKRIDLGKIARSAAAGGIGSWAAGAAGGKVGGRAGDVLSRLGGRAPQDTAMSAVNPFAYARAPDFASRVGGSALGGIGSWAAKNPEVLMKGVEAAGEGRHASRQADFAEQQAEWQRGMAEQQQAMLEEAERRRQEEWEYSRSPEALARQMLTSGAWRLGRY
jgi:hypothetical protein